MVEKTESDNFLDKNGNFSGEKFVHYLETEGNKIRYDYNTTQRCQLPSYYDEAKFTKAQELFEKYRISLLLVQLVGLMILLAHATAIKIIMMTSRSSNPSTAGIRYMETLKHVMSWYTSDFSERSELWKSINRVKYMHHSANLQAGKSANITQITQFTLGSTVIGFIGFAVLKPKCFGMGSVTDSELESLIHFWRVIGYLMGVEDRFNICRESLRETKEIFQELLNIHGKHHLQLRHPDSLQMQLAALNGINKYLGQPTPKILLNFTYEMVFTDFRECENLFFRLNVAERFQTFCFKFILKCLQYEFIRNCLNFLVEQKISKLKL